MKRTSSPCSIIEYRQYLHEHPKRANKKIKAVYDHLAEDIEHPRTIEYVNKTTGEVETVTYVFDKEKAQRPIRFIESMCKH